MIKHGTILQINYDNSVLLLLPNTIMQYICCTYFSSYLLAAPCEYVRHGLVLGLDWTSYRFSSTCFFFVCPGPPSILTIHVSHVLPPVPTGQLNTSTQVNNMAMLRHIYIMVTHIQCCASKIIFSGSGSYLDLNFGSGFESGSGLFMKNTLEIQMI